MGYTHLFAPPPPPTSTPSTPSPARGPKTCKILSKILPPHTLDLCRDGGGEIIFSRLNGDSRILPHVAPTNHRLTCHLGLIVPPESEGKCEIRVGNKWCRWETGKAIVFDDSFEHEVVNSTNLPRLILLIRFWHPDFDSPASMRSALNEAVNLKEVSEASERALCSGRSDFIRKYVSSPLPRNTPQKYPPSPPLLQKLHRQRWVVPLDDRTIEARLPPEMCSKCRRCDLVLQFKGGKRGDGKGGGALELACKVCRGG